MAINVYTSKEARIALKCSPTKLWHLIATGAIESYLDGCARRIIIASVDAYMTRKVAAGKDANGKVILDTRLDGCRGRGNGKKRKPDDPPSPQT